MSKGYRSRRVKLKSHGQGHDRHNKTVAFEMKMARREKEHVKKGKPRKTS